ncbi:MAG: fumarylacetoacetate hydrolase family protein [Oscillospiraceae bacterium]|jgi:2-keto-4-pentenoate hydratase/2-oxohepta-3-ene-1,7-dioic acid hydratase in catechol pathway|nr:fumarylacetoacetate hydrolase family protein [Oscillospiraceae bacterium]
MSITTKQTSEVFAQLGSPGQIIIVGWNYKDHTPGGDGKGPAEPIWYPLSPYSLNSDGAAVPFPEGMERVEMEAELVVVIGKEARRVSKEDALDYVYGFACGNDVSCRDIQNHPVRPNLPVGKTFDGFCPIGGTVVSGLDVSDIMVTGRLNGEVVMRDSTRHMFFSVPELIEHITRYHKLLPGDLIFTGTPRSCASTIVHPGDTMEVEIAGVGTLTNSVLFYTP